MYSETSESEESCSSGEEVKYSKTICKTLYENKSLEFESESDQELSIKDIKKRLTAKPNDFKHCKLEMERHNQACAWPLDKSMPSIKISGRENVGRSFPGDEVCVEILKRKQSVCEGRVVGLIKRDENALTFICKMVEDSPDIVTPVNKRMTRIKTVQSKTETGNVEVRQYNEKFKRWERKEFINISENRMLIVKILKWEKGKFYPLGVITKVISEGDALNEMINIEFDCAVKPPPFKPQEQDETDSERKDLCEVTTFTIDPTNAQDLDDAISVTEMKDSYQIGIHITDVASYIKKDSEPDKFARKQGRTLYTPEKGEVTFMFSRDLSNNYLSLDKDKENPEKKLNKAISLLVDVDKKSYNILRSHFELTYIRSNNRLSYEESDKIIQKYCLDKKPLRSVLHKAIVVAYRFSEAHRKHRMEGWPAGGQAMQSQSHAMVEELMNLYNSAVAEELISSDVTKNLTPLRCHREPEPGRLDQFKKKYGDLIPLSPNLSNICDVETDQSESSSRHDNAGISFNIFTFIFQKMEEFVRTKNNYNLMQLICADEIHPTLIPMVQEFRDIQRKAVILRSCSSNDSRLGHYDLRLNAYTWASSPMRRYLDLILQRLLHTVLSEKEKADYTLDEINQFCQSGMDAEEKHDALVLKLTHFWSVSEDVVKLAVVDKLTPRGHDFMISFPLHRMLEGIAIMYKHLQVVDQPKYNKDKNSVTLHWRRRVYSFNKAFKNRNRPMKNVKQVSSALWKGLVSAVKQQDWDNIEQCFQDMKRWENEEMTLQESEASSEEEVHYKNVTMELKLGKVVQVQLGTELKDGFPVPVVQLLNVNKSFEICLEHTNNPIKCFFKSECDASKTWYKDYKEYQKIWRQLCQRDTAYNAVEENNSVILEDVHIKWTGGINQQGFFYLTKTEKKKWSLEFDVRNCFLCIRLRHQRPVNKSDAKCLDDSGISDLQGPLPFTWVAHAVTSKPKKQNDKDTDRINFQITQTSMSYIPPTILNEGTKFTVEVIPKKIPYLLREQAITNIKRANHLVKSVATGQQVEELDNNAEDNIVLCEVNESLNLPLLNESQQKAVEEAVKKPFTVIQGPPGTGKTVVGIHIVYQFFKKNKAFLASSEFSQSASDQKPPKKPAILYCGPSNKSVDIVAEQLLKLSGVLKPLRVYCDQMEMREFPYTNSELKLCRRSLRDDKPREELRDITTMYLVRKPENPFSKEIESHLKEDETDIYREKLKEAHRYEIEKCDVVLCTCSSALKPEIREVMDFRQILIDECAMATEPEAFIPLVSHNPQQIVLLGDHKQIRPIVQCALVKKMGMIQSLFERYMDRAIMLDTQYRMHEEICRFPSEEFYEGKLKTGAERGPPILLNKYGYTTPILFGHVQGKEESLVVSTTKGNENSVANKEEAKQAVRVARLLIKKAHIAPQNIAILTPYNSQVSEIKKEMEGNNITNVNVCTIMKSQGSEWPYVIISTVRSCSTSDIQSYSDKGWLGKRLGFVTDPNQVNVAITRAQDGLCILGNSDLLRCCELWKGLLDHYYKKSCVINLASNIEVVAAEKQ